MLYNEISSHRLMNSKYVPKLISVHECPKFVVIKMDLIRGTNLCDYTRLHGPFPPDFAKKIVF
jgi:hypothetical protein